MSTSTKRRKISDDSDAPADVVPSTVLSTPTVGGVGGIGVAGAVGIPEGVELIKQELEEIQKLVMIDIHKDDPDDLAEAMKKLFISINPETPDGKKHRVDALAMGAIGTIVRAMKKWQMHEGIQRRGCRCMLRFAFNSDEGRHAIILSGGIEAAMNAMKVLPESENVQRAAFGMFRNMFAPLRTEATPPPEIESLSNRFVEDLKGLELLVKASKKFPDNAEIQENCCAVFEFLAIKKEFKAVMKKAGVPGAVGVAMENHLEEKDVQRFAEGFMKNLVKK